MAASDRSETLVFTTPSLRRSSPFPDEIAARLRAALAPVTGGGD